MIIAVIHPHNIQENVIEKETFTTVKHSHLTILRFMESRVCLPSGQWPWLVNYESWVPYPCRTSLSDEYDHFNLYLGIMYNYTCSKNFIPLFKKIMRRKSMKFVTVAVYIEEKCRKLKNKNIKWFIGDVHY